MGRGEAAAQDQDPLDKRLLWLEARYILGLKLKPVESKKLMDNEDYRQLMLEFVDQPDRRSIFILGKTDGSFRVINAEDIQGRLDPKKKIFYFTKLRREKLADENILAKGVMFGDITVDILQSMHSYSERIVLPLLQGAKGNAPKVAEVNYSSLLDNTHQLLAQNLMTLGRSNHRTLLPIPATELPQYVHVPSAHAKEVIYEVEAAVVQWSDSIRAAMASTPEELPESLKRWPGPLDEIAFWLEKKVNLTQLEEQLCQPYIARASVLLKTCGSSYYPAFNALGYELHKSLEEASEIHRYLKPMAELFESINTRSGCTVEFAKLPEEGVFRKIFHLLYFIWTNTSSFSTTPRMVTLISELCNDVIEAAAEDVPVADIFVPDNPDIVNKMISVLAVCGDLKSAFFQYKAKTTKELQRSWRFQNTALFKRLDAFMERCHDLLDVHETSVLFYRLANVRVGGPQGVELSREVENIQRSYNDEHTKLHTSCEESLLDISTSTFDIAYDEFREKVHVLEQRLSSVMVAVADETSGLTNLYKAIDTFDGFIDRPVLHQEWALRQKSVVEQWQKELLNIKQHFEDHRENPILFPNVPVTSSAITWAQGLQQRVQVSHGRILELDQTLLKSALGEETLRLYESLRVQLRGFIHSTYDAWAGSVGQDCSDCLKNCLLVRDTEDKLRVNFDPRLVRTLQEVKHFDSLTSTDADDQYVIPPQVITLNKQREALRSQVLRLEYICTVVNSMEQEVIPSERALLDKELAQLQVHLAKGVDDLQWQATDVVEQYLTEVVADVQHVERTVERMHTNVTYMRDMFSEFTSEDKFLPLIATKTDARVLSDAEFKRKLADHKTARDDRMKAIGDRVHELVADSLTSLNELKTTLSLPTMNVESTLWADYVEYLTTCVGEMLSQSIATSLTHVEHQLDEKWLSEHQGLPLIDVKLGITRPKDSSKDKPVVIFDPPLTTDKPGGHSLEGLMDTVMFNIVNVSEQILLLDTTAKSSDLRFTQLIAAEGALIRQQDKIRVLAKTNSTKCQEYVTQFEEYDFLYHGDMQSQFKQFMAEKREVADMEAERINNSAETPSNEQKRLMEVAKYYEGVPLSDFDAEIRRYEDLEDVLDALPASILCGFVRVDSKPMKAGLLELCNRWRDLYLGYLTNKALQDLTDLYTFIDTTEVGLSVEVIDGDIDTLKLVMRGIRDCKRKNEQVAGMLEPITQATSMLRHHPAALNGDVLDKIEELRKPAQEAWNSCFRKSLNTREQNSHAQDREAGRLKEDTSNFEERILTVLDDLRRSELYAYKLPPQESYQHIDTWSKNFVELDKSAAELWDLQELFDLTASPFKEMKEGRAELVMLKHTWDLVNHVTLMFSDWMTSPFIQVDVDGFLDDIKKLIRQLKSQPLKAKGWGVYKGLEETVGNMNQSLPLCAELRSPAMRSRHWESLLKTAGQSGSVDPNSEDFTLSTLIGLGIHKHADEVYNIVEKATKELHIERALNKIVDAWEKLTLSYDMNTKLDSYLLSAVDAVVEQLEADNNTLQAMLSNRFVDFFIEKVQKWQRDLGIVDSCITKWADIQRKWVNLYPIFVLSADIREQLPDDARNFQVADDLFRSMMRVAHTHTNVIEVLCTNVIVDGLQRSDDLESLLVQMEDILIGCERSLTEYLETKRKIFPRFYFVSSADLVDILSKGSDPRAVMVHMSKIVDSVDVFEFDGNPDPTPNAGPKTVWEMISVQGEHVKLKEEYSCEGPVETWLAGTISAMQRAIRFQISEANGGYVDRPRNEWIYSYPCQAVIVASRSWYTTECQSAFQMLEEGTETAMKEFLKLQRNQLDSLIKEVLLERPSNDRKMLVHLITIDVHNRDIVAQLVDDKIDSVESFAWQSQLRYYWDEKQGSLIRICDADFVNGYEYVGLCGCLVITKLTDRCYTTLSQALRLKKGGAPAGPAGTGKTETTKDLARNLGIACYVFNCSDQMNYITLGQIFKGLAMSGSWGCFDEFNRISIEVLSVVATQVSSILNALKSNRREFRFMDEKITNIPTVGMFITMNPGYAGRTELPENIKSLFRPCAMCVPDLKNICEIMLAAEGFGEAKDLALKFVTLYRLNKELLSPQQHYDWGLRAVKSVLYIAGSLRRADLNVPQRKVLLRALRDTNLAKLSKDDVYVFMGLIRALFPQLEVQKKEKPDLAEALRVTCKEHGNFPGENDIFILKGLQYEEILHVRHSVFILGPTGCGKTQMWKCVQGALTKLGDKCATQALNPKAITSNELYGYIHPQTKEWRDGVLSNIFRNFALESKAKKNSKWIVLDGIIDAEWIESMNTVMDDNKMLTLVSNERIPLTDSMRMLFEVSHLQNASPATVSRAGVVFINESDLGWGPFKDRWLASRDADNGKEASHLETFFDRYLPPAFEYWHRVCKTVVSVMDINIVQTICFLLEGLLAKVEEKTIEVYERYFCFACVWAFGGPLPSDGRIDYRALFSTWWRKENQHLKIGETGTVFDFYIDATDKYEFKLWADLVTKYQHDPDVPLSQITVQTADTVRMSALMSLLVDRGKPVMLVGTAGTGKSNLIMSKLRTVDNTATLFRVISFNARTNAASLQQVMEQSLEKRSGRTFGPIGRKKMIFFIDDANMPQPDKYGTQDAIALLQQVFGYGFWYDRTKITLKEIVDLRYIAAMNPKSGAFTILDRYLRHFALFSTNMPDRVDLVRIYGQVLAAHYVKFGRDVTNMVDSLTNATIEIHLRVTKDFLPTAILFHYQWNMRELFNIFQGMCKANVKIHNAPVPIVRLWTHECLRTFKDRMPLESDMTKFDELLTTIQKSFFSELPPHAFDYSATPPGADAPGDGSNVWAPFTATADEEGVYDHCSMDKCYTFLTNKLSDYNSTMPMMDLVLFNQAIEHVCRIARITSNPSGNALLVGVGGSGKQSLARLASYLNNLEIYQIQVTSAYGLNDFRTDMQELYKKTGLKGNPYSFIITDQQIVTMDMLVYLNDMLNSGNVPDMFIQDEKDAIVNAVVNEVKASGHPDYSNPDVCWEFFITKVRSNLHIVLCFSPVGATFARWCRQFPALANTTVIDWFHPWPETALRSVANRFLEEVDLGGEETTTAIAEFMAKCHDGIGEVAEHFYRQEKRRCYTTPKSFLELIGLYKKLLGTKRDEVQSKMARLENGIQMVVDAATQVASLQQVLQEESVEVEEARERTMKLMEHVGRERSIVEDQSAIAEAEEGKTNKIVNEVEAFASECSRDLAAAQPLVDEAMAALNTLDKPSLTELKSMTRPPDDVAMVVAAVRVLTAPPNRIPPTKQRDWGNCKGMMANVGNWMKDLLNFDINNIPQPCVDAIQIYVNNPAFVPTNIVTKSFAASGLCKWVVGMNEYHKVRCEVKPKEEKLAEAQDRLASSKSQLKKIEDKVAELKAKLDILVKQYDQAVTDKEKIEAKAKKTKDKVSLAERLVHGLADEKVRWGKTIEELKLREARLVGDVLVASAFVSYIGPFTREFRESIVNRTWLPIVQEAGIPMTGLDFDVVLGVLTTEADVASWNNDGLPNDTVSTQNGSLMTNCTRWPLMIDPQLQGVRWIKTKEQRRGLVIVQPGGKAWLTKITRCVEEGIPCLIEGCNENLDPVLDPLLGRVTYRRGGRTLIKIGSQDVEYHKDFQLYLQTKLSNPIYKPEINAQTTLINFMVTETGLEDQLLAVVVNQERPDLEKKRVSLIRNMNTMTIDLQQCEDGLLMELSNAKPETVLENVGLVDNLEATKKKAGEINRSMALALETQTTITKSRLTYSSVAARGALLFFQIDQLNKVDHMYQYSLEAFMVVFNKALAKADQPDDKTDFAKRVENVTASITESVFAYVARGLFERHKLIFSSLLCFAILTRTKDIDRKQLDFLLRGKRKQGMERPETVQEWVSEANWSCVQALAEVEGATPSFALLPSDMAEHNRWKMWCDNEKPEDEKMPADWKNLTPFQRLLVLRCLRPDRLTSALENFVSKMIGKFFVSDQAVDLSVSYLDAGCTTPLFFILSPGVDPIKAVEKLGLKEGFTYDKDNLHNVSLGQGQEIVAEKALHQCFTKGGWVMLNNVHLVEKWLRKLEKLLDAYSGVYTKMAQDDKATQDRRNARRLQWLAEQAEEKALAAQNGEDSKKRKIKSPHTPIPNTEEGTQAEGAEEKAAAQEQEDRPGSDEEEEAEEVEEEPNFDSDEEEEDEGENATVAVNEDGLPLRGSPELRIFLSAEPSTSIPIGILQSSIKLTSEPPSGISQNIKRALMNFSDEPWERSAKPTEFRSVMFTMCWFHAVVVERKKFGPQGWNRVYPFNVGDLTTCVDVLGNYIEDRPKVPWEDLRYVFGEIMYGGHITDDRDRVLCMAYLEQLVVPECVEGMDLAPGFGMPATTGPYQDYIKYVDEACPNESPILYGLHPNAEINFRSAQADVLFRTINELQPKQAAEAGAETPEEVLRNKIVDLLEKMPETFNLADISERLDEDRTPPQHVFFQECERINALLECMKRTLTELQLGLRGALSMTGPMQLLFDELFLEKVPDVWTVYSFASLRPLGSWFENMGARNQQLVDWTGELVTPKVTMISHFFNPMSLITAIMQHTAMTSNLDLDQMGLVAEVTKRVPEQIDAPARDAAHIYGLHMEGARWDSGQQSMDDARMKELYPKMPVITIRSQQLGKIDRRDQYECPVYKTQARGPTFVVGMFLKTKQPARKWTIAGVGLLLDVVE